MEDQVRWYNSISTRFAVVFLAFLMIIIIAIPLAIEVGAVKQQRQTVIREWEATRAQLRQGREDRRRRWNELEAMRFERRLRAEVASTSAVASPTPAQGE